MDEYIKREDVLQTLKKANIGGYITERLLEIPFTDVQPAKHGEWLIKENAILTNECSLCKRSVSMLEAKFYRFCPYCGARMDSDTE